MAAIDAFTAIFEPEAAGATVRRFVEDSEGRKNADMFRRGERIVAPVGGNEVGWKEVRFSRGLATLAGPGDPTKAAKKPQQTQRSGSLLDVKENADLDPHWLYLLQNPSLIGDNAVQNASRQFADALQNLGQRLRNTVEYVVTKALEDTLDLATVPNSDLTGDLTLPVHQLSALAAWATASTKIRSEEMPRIVDLFVKKAGMKAATAVATKETEKAVIQNTELAQYLSEGSLAARTLESIFMERGGAIPRMGGIDWAFENFHYALDSAPDTEIDYQSSDRVLVFPSDMDQRRALAMGTGWTAVPAGPIVAPNGQFSTANAMISWQEGAWAYLELSTNPVKVRLHAGTRFLPILKIPNGTMSFKTTP